MFNEFEEEAREVMVNAKAEMLSLKHPYVGSEHLLLAILKKDNDVSRSLKKYNLDYDKFKKELINIVGVGSKKSKWFLYTPLLRRVIENAIVDSKENNEKVSINYLFSSILEEGDGVALRILIGMNIDLDELYNEFSYKIYERSNKVGSKVILNQLGDDLTKKAMEGKLDPVIGREKELKRVIEILSRRTKNNPLLVGLAGVGKTAIVEELSNRIALGDVPTPLKNKKIISISMASMVAGTKYRGEFEERINKLLNEIEDDKDIILFIDEIHTLVGAGGAEGAIDASNIFKPALSRNKIRVIGATTLDEYKKYIETDKALERRFQKVYVNIPTKEEVRNILTNIKEVYEDYHNVLISDECIDRIIDYSNKYIHDRNEPDKSIDILDEVCAYASLKETNELKKYNSLKKKLQKVLDNKNKCIINNDFEEACIYKNEENKLLDKINKMEMNLYIKKRVLVTLDDIDEVINKKTRIPIYKSSKLDKKTIENISKKLKNKIVGQDQSIDILMKNYKKIHLGLNDNKCYSMMFCGMSGIGKTMLAREFAKELVGDENIIKLDMSEYANSDSVNKILGSSPGYVGYDDYSNVLEEIRNKPYSVLILDEIEKASSRVINLFLQILEDGKIRDNKGNVISFNNVVIIMTSNVGYDQNSIGFDNKNSFVTRQLNEVFNVPFINRIDDILIFNKLSEDSMNYLIKNKIKILKNKYLNKNINVIFNKNIYSEILDKSNYLEYGARQVDKIIKNKVENQIVDGIINDLDTIVIDSLEERATII